MNGCLKIYFVSLILLIIFYSCGDVKSYPDEPEIKFEYVYLADTVNAAGTNVKLQKLCFEVVDGDGNIGGYEQDTSNLFISILAKRTDGTYREITDFNGESIKFKYRIPYNQPVGQNKYLKASVRVKIESELAYFNYDTIKYEFYVYDRDLNRSNTEESCDIPVKLHGTVYSDGEISVVEEEEEVESE